MFFSRLILRFLRLNFPKDSGRQKFLLDSTENENCIRCMAKILEYNMDRLLMNGKIFAFYLLGNASIFDCNVGSSGSAIINVNKRRSFIAKIIKSLLAIIVVTKSETNNLAN